MAARSRADVTTEIEIEPWELLVVCFVVLLMLLIQCKTNPSPLSPLSTGTRQDWAEVVRIIMAPCTLLGIFLGLCLCVCMCGRRQDLFTDFRLFRMF
jgi:hypothetical protein